MMPRTPSYPTQQETARATWRQAATSHRIEACPPGAPSPIASVMTAIAPSVLPAVAEAADEPAPIPAPVLAVLVDNRARFLAFLEKRVGGRDAAEEILQQAYVRGMDRGGGLRAGESAVAWFYRLLRNVMTDHWRRCDAERRALAAYAGEAALTAADDGALLEAVCGCVTALVDT